MTIAITFDKVKIEFREFAVDSVITSCNTNWSKGTVNFLADGEVFEDTNG